MPYRTALDALNFFLADVRSGLGPYVGIFLLTQYHWNPAEIGLVATITGLAALVLQAPIGAFIDNTHWKRGVIIAAVIVLAMSAIMIMARPSFPVVATAPTAMAVVGDVFAPAVAAITLGLIGQRGLATHMGRNAAFDHAGNVFTALVAGAIGWWFSQSAVFLLVPIFAIFVILSVLSIPGSAIDYARARGLADGAPQPSNRHPSGWRVLVTCRPLLVFALCVTLFHFANAAMLPLVGQKLALANRGQETALMSACIIAAQLVMLPMALLVGARADRWGRKSMCLVAFAILPIRGVLYTLSDDHARLTDLKRATGVSAERGSRHARRPVPMVGIATLSAVLLLGLGLVLATLYTGPQQLRYAWPIASGVLPQLLSVVIFAATYGAIAIGKLPRLHLDRAGAALLGASLMVASGALSIEDAYQAIDFDTITLLLGMMIVVANVRISGVFQLITTWLAQHVRRPLLLLVCITLVSGYFSAFLVNDMICLVLTPLVLDLARRQRLNPVPFLLALGMASNVGSVATLTGNPQNMFIGSVSHIPYVAFATALTPVATIGLAATVTSDRARLSR
jgi:MFS family permease